MNDLSRWRLATSFVERDVRLCDLTDEEIGRILSDLRPSPDADEVELIAERLMDFDGMEWGDDTDSQPEYRRRTQAALTALQPIRDAEIAAARREAADWSRPFQSDAPARKDIPRNPEAPGDLYAAIGLALFRSDLAGMNAPDAIAEIGNAAFAAIRKLGSEG